MPLEIDSQIAFTLLDQFDKPHTLPVDTKKLIFGEIEALSFYAVGA